MSTSKTYQQSLADAGSETRPPMLERGSYIPWASRFKRFLNRKRENRKWLLKALEDGPYVFRNITPTGLIIPRLQEVEDLQGDDLLYYDAEMELMNMILLAIPNEIYNSMDSCKTAKEMWAHVERKRKLEKLIMMEEFEQYDVHNHSEDPLASAMFHSSDRVNIQAKIMVNIEEIIRRAMQYFNGVNVNCGGKRNYARNCPKPRVSWISKYFMEQMLLAKQDEASVYKNSVDEPSYGVLQFISENSKRASKFYTSKEEIALNDFCRDQVRPLLNELLDYFDGFQNLFQRDIKEMKDAFKQNDVYLDEIERQNDLLKDQLLEASLKHDIELCVLLLDIRKRIDHPV
ncbi:hypothetical protein Tco_1256432 [Tanacetum coccineum]